MPMTPTPSSPGEELGGVFDATLTSELRIYQYARATRGALHRLLDGDPPEVTHPKIYPYTDEETSRKRAHAFMAQQSDFYLLKRERDVGAGLTDNAVNNQATLALWSAFETGAEDLLFSALRIDPTLAASTASEKLSALKISYGDFLAMNDEERMHQLVRDFSAKLSSKERQGFLIFESRYEAFGLGKGVEPSVKQAMREFGAVRNCLAHRRGIIDAPCLKLMKELDPNTSAKIGNELYVTTQELTNHLWASLAYLAEVLVRIFEKFGLDTAAPASRMQASRKLLADSLAGNTDPENAMFLG